METEELNKRSRNLDTRSIEEILHIINVEDRTIIQTVNEAIPQIKLAVKQYVKTFTADGDIYYVGAGTSGRLGILDSVELPPTFGIATDRVNALLAGGEEAFSTAKEGQEDLKKQGDKLVEKHNINSDDFVIGISASGSTPFVLGCVTSAAKNDIPTAGITNNEETTLEEICDIPIVAPTGPEVLAGSTRMKAGTAQKMVLNMLSTTAMIKSGKVFDNFMVDVEATNEKLKQRALRILETTTSENSQTLKKLLEENDYAVKPVLLMVKADLSFSQARQILERHDGYLRQALKSLNCSDD